MSNCPWILETGNIDSLNRSIYSMLLGLGALFVIVDEISGHLIVILNPETIVRVTASIHP